MNLGLDKLKLSLSLSMGIALKLVPYLGAGEAADLGWQASRCAEVRGFQCHLNHYWDEHELL